MLALGKVSLKRDILQELKAVEILVKVQLFLNNAFIAIITQLWL